MLRGRMGGLRRGRGSPFGRGGGPGESNNPLAKLFVIKKLWLVGFGLVLGLLAAGTVSPVFGVFIFMIFLPTATVSVSTTIQEHLEEAEDPRIPTSGGDSQKKFILLRTLDSFKRFNPLIFSKPFAVSRAYFPHPGGIVSLVGTGSGTKKYSPVSPFLKLKYWPPNRVSFWVSVCVAIICACLHYILLEANTDMIAQILQEQPDAISVLPGILTYTGIAGSFVGGFLLSAAFAEALRWAKQDMPETAEDEPDFQPGYIMPALSIPTFKTIFPFYKYNPSKSEKKSLQSRASVHMIFPSDKKYHMLWVKAAGLSSLVGVPLLMILFSEALTGSSVFAGGAVWGALFVILVLRYMSKIIKDEMLVEYKERKRKEAEWVEMWESLTPMPPIPGWITTRTLETGYMINLEEAQFALPEGANIAQYQRENEIASMLKMAGVVLEGSDIRGKQMVLTSAELPKYLTLFMTKSSELGNPEMMPHLRSWETAKNGTPNEPATTAALFALRTVLRDAVAKSSLPGLILVDAYQYHKSTLNFKDSSKNKKGIKGTEIEPSEDVEPVVWRMECLSRGKTITLKEAKQRQDRLAKSMQCQWMRICEDVQTGKLEIWASNVMPEDMTLKDEEKVSSSESLPIPGGAATVGASELREMVIRMDWTEIIYKLAGDIPSGFELINQKCSLEGGPHRLLAETSLKPVISEGKLKAEMAGSLGASWIYIENIEAKNTTRISWGVNIDSKAYIEVDETEQVRRETLINAWREHWGGSKTSTVLPQLTEVIFHSDEHGLDLMEMRCLPGKSTPLADLKVTSLLQTMQNMGLKWMRIGQQSEGGDSFGYSIVFSVHPPPPASININTEVGKWIYCLNRVWGMSQTLSALYGMQMEDIRPLDVDSQLFETVWNVPGGVPTYQVTNALRDIPKEYTTPVAIAGELPKDDKLYIVFGDRIPMDSKKWVKEEDQKQVNMWGWQDMMRICQIETADHNVPEIIDTKIIGNTTRHTLKLPSGMSPEYLHKSSEAMKVAGKYLYLEIGQSAGDTLEVICAYEDPLPELAAMPLLFPRPRTWSKIPVGVGVKYNPAIQKGYSEFTLEWDLKMAPHMLLCGTTGSGKSSAIRVIAAEAIARGFNLFLVDAIKEGGDFMPFVEHEYFAHETAFTLKEAHELINKVYQRGKTRLKYMSDHGVPFWGDLPPEVRSRPELLIIDECFSMLDKSPANTPEGKAENDMKAEILGIIVKIARESRSTGLHMIITAQRPDANVIKGEMKNNLSCRMILGSADHTVRQMVLSDSASAPDPGRDMPKGRGVLEQTGENAKVIHTFWSGEDQELLDNLCGVFNKIWETKGIDKRMALRI